MSVRHRRNALVATIIGALVCIVSVLVYTGLQWRCDALQCVTLPGIDDSTSREVLEKTDTVYRAIYTLPDARIRVEKRNRLSRSDADILTKVSVMRLQGQFETARSPYPGILSDAITCDEKFNIKPVTTTYNNQEVLTFTGYLNDRLQYGACMDEEIRFIGLNAILYCDTHQTWYRIEVLLAQGAQSPPEYTKQLQNIVCQ